MSQPIYLLTPVLDRSSPTPEGPEFPGMVRVSQHVFALPGERRVRDILVKQLFDATRGTDGRVHAPTLLVRAGALTGAAVLHFAFTKDLTNLNNEKELNEKTLANKHNVALAIREIIKQVAICSPERGKLSVSRIVNGGAVFAGSSSVCDALKCWPKADESIEALYTRQPLVAPEHRPIELPRESVAKLWPKAKQFLLSAGTSPEIWHKEFAATAQVFLIMGKDAVPPNIGANLILQSAIAMAFLNPGEIGLQDSGGYDPAK